MLNCDLKESCFGNINKSMNDTIVRYPVGEGGRMNSENNENDTMGGVGGVVKYSSVIA